LGHVSGGFNINIILFLSEAASALFSSWAPDLAAYYNEKIDRLLEEDPSLKKPFHSVFTAATYNLGPRTVCKPHVDFANLPFGLCSVTALGKYDHRKGGHTVLHEYKLILQFPPGATILIPSAIVTHSNLPIGEDEQHFSFTQYSAGGLFWWMDNGFQTIADLQEKLNDSEKVAWEEENQNRWKFGLDLLPKLYDFAPL
jgi:hypothetical protein